MWWAIITRSCNEWRALDRETHAIKKWILERNTSNHICSVACFVFFCAMWLLFCKPNPPKYIPILSSVTIRVTRSWQLTIARLISNGTVSYTDRMPISRGNIYYRCPNSDTEVHFYFLAAWQQRKLPARQESEAGCQTSESNRHC